MCDKTTNEHFWYYNYISHFPFLSPNLPYLLPDFLQIHGLTFTIIPYLYAYECQKLCLLILPLTWLSSVSLKGWHQWSCQSGWEKSTGPQLYTMNYRQLRKAGSKRDHPSHGRAQQLVVLCQTVSHKNTHASNIIRTERENVSFWSIEYEVITLKFSSILNNKIISIKLLICYGLTVQL